MFDNLIEEHRSVHLPYRISTNLNVTNKILQRIDSVAADGQPVFGFSTDQEMEDGVFQTVQRSQEMKEENDSSDPRLNKSFEIRC